MTKLVSTNMELAALRGLCSKKRVLSGKILSQIDETYFHNPESLKAYQRIRNTITRTGAPPVWSALVEDPSLEEGVRDFLSESDTIIKTEEEAASAIRILFKYRQLRGLYLIAEDVLETLQGKKVSASDLVERMGDSLANLRVNKSLKDIALHIGKGNNSLDLVRKMLYEKRDDAFIPSGFRDFDTKNGGFFYKSLVTLGGTSGAGKSALASQLCKFWASIGIKVVMVPLEMSKEEQTARLLANISKVDIRKILLQRLNTEEKEMIYNKFRRYARKCSKLGGRYTVFKPEEDMTIEEILSVSMTYGPKVVIVDYISLLKGVDGDDQWRKLGAVARYCKIFASNNDIIVVLLAQVNEEGKLRYSQAVKEHSDLCWTFIATKESRENKIINVEQLKARNMEQFPFSLKADLAFMQVGDLQESIEDDVPEEASKKKKTRYLEDLSDAE